MSETRDDLREALARCICVASGLDPDFDYDPRGVSQPPGQNVKWRLFLPHADALIAGPLAQVSALQAEVERWKTSFDGHVYVTDADFDALCRRAEKAEAEVERLQKVEGERAAARDDLEAVDALATEWCQGRAYRSSGSEDARDGYVRGATSVAGEVRRLIHARDPEFHNRIAARQAPSDNPLTETKEGLDA